MGYMSSFSFGGCWNNRRFFLSIDIRSALSILGQKLPFSQIGGFPMGTEVIQPCSPWVSACTWLSPSAPCAAWNWWAAALPGCRKVDMDVWQGGSWTVHWMISSSMEIQRNLMGYITKLYGRWIMMDILLYRWNWIRVSIDIKLLNISIGRLMRLMI